MKTNKHNPNYKLVGLRHTVEGKKLELVYGISNEGENEGLEVYFLNEDGGHYRSYRYLTNRIPDKYRGYFNSMRELSKQVPAGHKHTLITKIGGK